MNLKDFGLLVSDPREWSQPIQFGADAGGSATSEMPLISSVSPANGGLQQFSRPVNIYNGQQWPMKVGMDAYKDDLNSVLDANPATAAWAAFGSGLGEQVNEFGRIFGGGDKNYSLSNQAIRDNFPAIAKLGDTAEGAVIGRFGKIPRVVLQGILATDKALNNR